MNEDYFLRLARRLRIPVARAELIHDREGRAGLVVQRFDRVLVDGEVRALAVEDARQLLGRYPADQYSLTSEQVSTAAATSCPARAVAARACLAQFVFAWLTGNGDMHAKNLSALQEADGEWRIVSAYDLPSTLPYGDRSMALSLDGRRQALTRKAFRSFGTGLGLPQRAVERTLDDVLRATDPLLDDLGGGALPLHRNATQDLVRQLGAAAPGPGGVTRATGSAGPGRSPPRGRSSRQPDRASQLASMHCHRRRRWSRCGNRRTCPSAFRTR